MNNFTVKPLNNETFTSISNIFIEEYMSNASGEFIKVYLYLLKCMSDHTPITIAYIADKLNNTEKDVKRALLYWNKEGVIKVNVDADGNFESISILPLQSDDDRDFVEELKNSSPKTTLSRVASVTEEIATTVVDTTPKKTIYNKQYINEQIKNTELSQLIYMVETYFGKPLVQTELNSLLYIYNDLSFSSDLLEYLIEYCVSNGKKSMRYIETVAISWHKQGIDTCEKAKLNCAQYNSNYTSVMKAIGANRVPTSIEAAYINCWHNDFGFETPIILEACKKAVLSKPNSVSIKYVNAILENWHTAGVKHMSDITTMDTKYQADKKIKSINDKVQSTSQAHNFKQRNYAGVDLEAMFINEVNQFSHESR